MKSLITSMASLAVLLAFLFQFTQFQVMYSHIICIDQNVNAFKEVVKQEGCVTDENAGELRHGICTGMDLKESRIAVSGTERPVQRGSRIHYRVAVPVRGPAGMEDFVYTIDRYTTSEYLGKGP